MLHARDNPKRRQKEEKKIADAAKKKRKEESSEEQETIISNIANIIKNPEAKTATNETPGVIKNPPINPPGPVVSQSPPTIPPLFLQQEKAKQETEKNNPEQTDIEKELDKLNMASNLTEKISILEGIIESEQITNASA